MGWLGCSGALLADPLIAFPSGDYSCTIEVAQHNTPKPDPAHPGRRYSPVIKKIAVTQVGKIRRDIIFYSDGSVSQLWNLVDKKVSLMQSDASRDEALLLRGDLRDGASPRLLHLDSDSVSWLTERALDKQSESGGGPLHYQASVVISEPGVVPVLTSLFQAWVDPKTLLPVKFDDGEALYILNFSKDVPAGPLVIPPGVKAEFNLWERVSATPRHL